jgi:hypothetical protein
MRLCLHSVEGISREEERRREEGEEKMERDSGIPIVHVSPCWIQRSMYRYCRSRVIIM